MSLSEMPQVEVDENNQRDLRVNEAKPPVCPHCDKEMARMSLPDNTGYECEFFYVCFNDDCSYFKDGWKWMWDKYRVKTSYRHRVNPVTGESGPLPVWSQGALKDLVLP